MRCPSQGVRMSVRDEISPGRPVIYWCSGSIWTRKEGGRTCTEVACGRVRNQPQTGGNRTTRATTVVSVAGGMRAGGGRVGRRDFIHMFQVTSSSISYPPIRQVGLRNLRYPCRSSSPQGISSSPFVSFIYALPRLRHGRPLVVSKPTFSAAVTCADRSVGLPHASAWLSVALAFPCTHC